MILKVTKIWEIFLFFGQNKIETKKQIINLTLNAVRSEVMCAMLSVIYTANFAAICALRFKLCFLTLSSENAQDSDFTFSCVLGRRGKCENAMRREIGRVNYTLWSKLNVGLCYDIFLTLGKILSTNPVPTLYNFLPRH
jgi:hypothetical protein